MLVLQIFDVCFILLRILCQKRNFLSKVEKLFPHTLSCPARCRDYGNFEFCKQPMSALLRTLNLNLVKTHLTSNFFDLREALRDTGLKFCIVSCRRFQSGCLVHCDGPLI